MSAKIATGKYTGTGSSINVEVGFVPDFLIILNYTDGDIVTIWHKEMTAATSVDIGAAAASNASGSVSPYTGAAGTASEGFSTGADNSESAKVFHWIAFAAA